MPLRPDDFESFNTLAQIQHPDHQKKLEAMMKDPNIDIGKKAIIAHIRANPKFKSKDQDPS